MGDVLIMLAVGSNVSPRPLSVFEGLVTFGVIIVSTLLLWIATCRH